MNNIAVTCLVIICAIYKSGRSWTLYHRRQAVYDCDCSVSRKMQTFLVLLSIVGTFALVFGQPKPCGKLYSTNRTSVYVCHTMWTDTRKYMFYSETPRRWQGSLFEVRFPFYYPLLLLDKSDRIGGYWNACQYTLQPTTLGQSWYSAPQKELKSYSFTPSGWPIQVLWQTGPHLLWCYWGENRNSWTWRWGTAERFLWWNCTLSESELLYTFILVTTN